MIPKTPQSYRISEPIRLEIIALMKDLDLVFVRKSFIPLPDTKFIRVSLTSSCRQALLDNPVKAGISCSAFMNRNHHRKDFKSVYASDYNNSQLSFGWD